jgi:hypothetical protein
VALLLHAPPARVARRGVDRARPGANAAPGAAARHQHRARGERGGAARGGAGRHDSGTSSGGPFTAVSGVGLSICSARTFGLLAGSCRRTLLLLPLLLLLLLLLNSLLLLLCPLRRLPLVLLLGWGLLLSPLVLLLLLLLLPSTRLPWVAGFLPLDLPPCRPALARARLSDGCRVKANAPRPRPPAAPRAPLAAGHQAAPWQGWVVRPDSPCPGPRRPVLFLPLSVPLVRLPILLLLLLLLLPLAAQVGLLRRLARR